MKRALVAMSLLLFSGCAITDYNKSILKPDCKADYSISFDPIYRGLNLATQFRECKNYKKSNELLKEVNQKFVFLNSKNTQNKVNDFLQGYIMNEKIAKYEGRFYDQPLSHLYMGLNYLELGLKQNAMEEFIKASKINENEEVYFQNELDLMVKAYPALGVDPTDLGVVEQKYNTMLLGLSPAKYAYNPYVAYLSAVFLHSQNEDEKALALLSSPKAKASYNAQLKSLEAVIKEDKSKHIYVIYENGRNPSMLTSFLTRGLFFQGSFMSVSIPLNLPQARGYSYKMTANNQGLLPLVNFDKVVAAEFVNNKKALARKDLLRALAKANHNYQLALSAATEGIASNYNSQINGIYNIITTRPDTRVWEGLFKTVEVRVFKNEGKISLKAGFKEIYKNEQIPQNKDIIIFIKSLSKDAKTQISLLVL